MSSFKNRTINLFILHCTTLVNKDFELWTTESSDRSVMPRVGHEHHTPSIVHCNHSFQNMGIVEPASFLTFSLGAAAHFTSSDSETSLQLSRAYRNARVSPWRPAPKYTSQFVGAQHPPWRTKKWMTNYPFRKDLYGANSC